MKSNENWLMDNTGDIKIKKNIILTEPEETIAQRLQNKISLNYKEWFLHESEGVNWFGTENLEGNIGKKLTELVLDSQIKNYINSDKDVSKILDYTTDFSNNGNYNIKISIATNKNGIIKL